MPLVQVPIRGASVDQILRIDDPALRNLWITQAYSEFARSMRRALGNDASWCAFAVWASGTAGRTIRLEDIPPEVRSILKRALPHEDPPGVGTRLLHRLVDAVLEHIDAVKVAASTVDGVSDSIAEGNTIVFAELGPAFAAFAGHLDDGRVPSPRDVLAADAPPELVDAFGAYQRAANSETPRQRAEFVLHANVVAVLHEQQRLDPNIDAALSASILEAILELDWPWFGLPIRPFIRRHLKEIDVAWGDALTLLMMTLRTSDETLRLRDDVPPPVRGRPLFPPDLSHPPSSADLAALLAGWDPTGGTGRGSGALNWTDLRQRMGFIVNLFRSRQQHPPMFNEPFTQDDLVHMQAGRLPPRFRT